MAAAENGRVVTLLILCIVPVVLGQDYQVPDVAIQALNPKGVVVSIPDNPKITLFVFQGRINREIGTRDVGDITAEITKPKNGFWTFRDDEVALKVGDVIHYYVHVIRNGKGYQKENLSYRVNELVDTPQSPGQVVPQVPQPPIAAPDPHIIQATNAPPTDCRQSPTVVSGRSVCSGQVIFEDNFDTLREDRWVVQHYIPHGPDHPFVSYQRPLNAGIVTVANGALRIAPVLQETLPGFDGDFIVSDGNRLDLSSGCTRPNSCVYQNQGPQIMPPIASGRLTSSLAFKYGVVEVRAKMPRGDWLYPDILLESMTEKYGVDNYASGILRIAGALGNSVLTKGNQDYSNKVLYGGPVMDFKCRDKLLATKKSATAWGEDFHIYTLRWAPDRITLLVDGEEWGRTEPSAGGLQALLPSGSCDPPRSLLIASTALAPFDEFFRVALGVSAGGISQFPDRTATQNSAPKPWKNSSHKARVAFYNDKRSWLSTWSDPALLVDYIRVYAI